MNLNRLFKLYEDFNVVFDTDSDNNLSTASKLETLKYADDKQLDTFIKRNFTSGSEFNKFLIKVFRIKPSDCNNLEHNFIDNIIPKMNSFDEFKKYGQGVTAINNAIFENSKIEHISLPDSLEYIGISAFANSKLKEIEITKNVDDIDHYAFLYCEELKSVTCSPRNPLYVLRQYRHIGSKAFMRCTNLETVDLSNFIGLISIDKQAFSDCNIKTLKLPNSLIRIEQDTFCGNPLKTLDLSNTSIANIGRRGFCECYSLKEVKFPKTLANIGSEAFTNTALKEVHLPRALKPLNITSAFPHDCKIEFDI